jgi:tRNA-specific 2-thiouridylase
VCEQLDIPHYVVDERERFQERVIDPFARDYAAGRTPNPCTRCNQHVKFGPLLHRAAALGAAAMATGHYARNAFGVALHRAVDPSKDQSYFLFSMGRAALRSTLFPLGGWTKDAVRARADALGLPNADAADSQELCFVPGGDHGVVVERRLGALGLPVDALGPGPVVDASGAVVGDHDGIHRVTIGQRRGFRTRGTQRRYVLEVIPASRTVVVGDAEHADVAGFDVDELQRLGLPDGDGEHRVHVQWRHRGTAEPATVHVSGARARVTFDAPASAAAPGQAAVFYRDDEVLGGGWIVRTF